MHDFVPVRLTPPGRRPVNPPETREADLLALRIVAGLVDPRHMMNRDLEVVEWGLIGADASMSHERLKALAIEHLVKRLDGLA